MVLKSLSLLNRRGKWGVFAKYRNDAATPRQNFLNAIKEVGELLFLEIRTGGKFENRAVYLGSSGWELVFRDGCQMLVHVNWVTPDEWKEVQNESD
jgi:hypothetical protein